MLATTLIDAISKLALGGDGAMGGTGLLELKKDLEVFSHLSLKGAIAEAREVKVNLDKTISFAQSALDLKDTVVTHGANPNPGRTQNKPQPATDNVIDYRKEVDRLMGALLQEGVPMSEISQSYAVFGKTPEMQNLTTDDLKFMAGKMRQDLEGRLAADALLNEMGASPDPDLRPGPEQYPRPGNSMAPGIR